MSESNTSTQGLVTYRILKQEIKQINEETTELTKDIADRANGIWRKVSQVPLNDTGTFEILLGAEVNEEVASLFHKTLPKLEVTDTYTLDYLITKLKDKVDQTGWEGALESFDFLRAPVKFEAFNRLRAPRVVDLKNKEKKQRVRVVNDVPSEATQPEEVSTENQRDGKKELASHVLRTLKRLYKEKNEPVGLWSFILDPTKFGRTVENMFTVNILVNDGNIKLIRCDDNYSNEEFYLQPSSSREKNERINPNTRKQNFIQITPEEYTKRLKAFKITRAKIPRLDTDSDDNS